MSKNRLFTGEVGAEDVIEMVKACPGTRYEVRPHHMKKSMDVHIMRPMNGRYSNWYVKFYFVSNSSMFISVHPESEET
ncbi:MAG TPA: hypothetical protein VK465_00210 [Fibrobacteria bacterium]|nr:hypothetical protein [Fibrobacteria bacterium]